MELEFSFPVKQNHMTNEKTKPNKKYLTKTFSIAESA